MIPNGLQCTLCGGLSFEAVIRFPEYQTTIDRCRGCGLMASHPFPPPEELIHRYQEGFYSLDGERFKGLAETFSRLFRTWRAISLYNRFSHGKSILDIGCGRGIMIHTLKGRGWSVSGTQISETASRYIFNAFGIRCFTGELSDAHFTPGSFDIITMWHVLEHLRDPLLYLRECHRLLKRPGGTLLVEVPNAGGWCARVTKAAWMGWGPEHHLHHFTPLSLDYALRKAGFSPIAMSYFSLEYGPYTTLQSILNLCGERDALFNALKAGHPHDHTQIPLHTKMISTFGKAIALAPLGFLASVVSALCSSGEVIRVYAKAE